MVEHHHRPTLKQQNKPFKSKHATKSSLKDAAKGRIPHASPKAAPAAAAAAAHARVNRRNSAKQAQAAKRGALAASTRVFSGADGAPRIVAVIPLTPDVAARAAVAALAAALGLPADDCPAAGVWRMRAERFKTALQFVPLAHGALYAALDAAKAADYVVLVLSAHVEVGPWGETLLRALAAQGLPGAVPVVLPPAATDAKARAGALRSLLSFVQFFAPGTPRVFDLAAPADARAALRALAEGRPADVRWRAGRAWVLAERAAAAGGALAVTGVVRGAALSADRLVHIPGHGDFQIAKIVAAPLRRAGAGMDVEPAVLAAPGDDADSLVSSNDPDDLANEQTWPTEEEMAGGAAGAGEELPEAQVGTTPKRVRRIPKGMSEYQAAWIVDEDEDEEGDEEGEEEGEKEGSEVEMQEEEEMQDLPVPEDDHEMESNSRVAFQDLDADEEAKQLETWRNREREEEGELAFPDEIDTPKDVPARTRFQRYRGMRSFRTSPWDPYENLPRDYARIFQFEDFKRTERGVRRRAEQALGSVAPGTRVTVYLRDVPAEAAAAAPLVLFGLLQHEHKVTVLNFTVQRNTEYDAPVRSKDALVLCVGPRRLRVAPVFSQHTRGGGKGANNVHKFERFLRHGVTSVATTYGPVVFGHQPCVLLRETADPEAPDLVATGTFAGPDTTRVIAKRIVLTGHPFKVHKKTATVRYMFFNAEDVQYFKPTALHTKHGRTGHIRESLGTHGYFKAHFDGPVNQMDTVCMSLYKRVFPRWAEQWRAARAAGGAASGAGADAMDVE